MKNDDAFTIRSYRPSDREAVRRLCCQTGFLGEPIDPIYEDRELFADFLTTYYTDHEPESSFVLEEDGELVGLSPRFAQAAPESALFLLPKRLSFSARSAALPRATTRVRAVSFSGS